MGSGLYGMLMFALLAVFIAGLMVGRTPEYLGKKIEAARSSSPCWLSCILPLSILGFTAVAVLASRPGQARPAQPGPHGFSEILYAFSSATGNNGSAFAGLRPTRRSTTPTLGVGDVVRPLRLRRSRCSPWPAPGEEEGVPASAGTFPTDAPLFTGLLIGVILIVGALTFFPALSLGPIVEHLQLTRASWSLTSSSDEVMADAATRPGDAARPGEPKRLSIRPSWSPAIGKRSGSSTRAGWRATR